ncbi:hypothetical protein HMPREF1141_2068 [Clostridium sp. MSTE9]|nr:hypothetical protein HMPREF1141_2068 [Clostridium sp. MSTE9]
MLYWNEKFFRNSEYSFKQFSPMQHRFQNKIQSRFFERFVKNCF